MHTAALVAWLLTASGGLVIVSIWIAKGGLRQEGDELSVDRPHGAAENPGVARTNLPHWMVASHVLAAVFGLAIFAYYLAVRGDVQTGVGPAPWVALGAALTAAALGVTMARRWSAYRKARVDGPPVSRSLEPADQAIPKVVVALHGLAALATIVLVSLVALRIGT